MKGSGRPKMSKVKRPIGGRGKSKLPPGMGQPMPGLPPGMGGGGLGYANGGKVKKGC